MGNVDWQHLKHIWIICIKVIKSSTYKTTGWWAYVGLSVYGAWATAVTQQYAEQLWHVEFSTLILLIHFPKFVSHTAVVPHAVLLDVTTHVIAPGSTCCSTWCRPIWYCSRLHMLFHLVSPNMILFQVAHAVPLGVAQYDIVPGCTWCSTWCRPIWYCSRLHMMFHLVSPNMILFQVAHAVPLGVAQYDIVPGCTCCSTWCRPIWYCSRLHMMFHLVSPHMILHQASHVVPG